MTYTPDDEADPVVSEVDVYLSQPPPNSDIYVLQYPLRHPFVGLGVERRVTNVRVRPQHGRVEMKLSVLPRVAEHGSGSFDVEQPLLEEKDIGMEQTLRSRANLSTPEANYAIATFSPRGLTLVPVRAVSQMRPAFDYLDKFDSEVSAQKAAEKAARQSARGIEEKKEKEEDVAPLQVSFRRRETERAAEKRKSSHASLRKREEDEAWVSLEFTSGRRETLLQMQTVVKEESLFDESASYADLFRLHTRHVRQGLVAKANVDTENVSRKALALLPLESAVPHVVTHARVVTLQDVHGIMPNAATNAVLDSLRSIAMCVRGCWVAKRGNRKGLEKLRAATERYEASRALVLNMFRDERIVTEHAAAMMLGDPMLISEETLRMILGEVADSKRGVGWEFRLEDDEVFQADFAEVCRKQDNEWETRVKTARTVLANRRR